TRSRFGQRDRAVEREPAAGVGEDGALEGERSAHAVVAQIDGGVAEDDVVVAHAAAGDVRDELRLVIPRSRITPSIFIVPLRLTCDASVPSSVRRNVTVPLLRVQSVRPAIGTG